MEKMRIFKAFMMAAAIACMTAMVACDPDDKEPEPTPPGDEWVGNDLKGTIDTEMRLVAGTVYKLSDRLFIEEGGVLNIPAGTKIEGTNGFDSYILVLQGGRININGTADKPVVMTSDSATPASGDWGGLIINGRAPLTHLASGQSSVKTTEINEDYEYGGNNPADNSGVIEYLILEGTGAKNSANVEHNGLTLNGVGRGTRIENVFVIDCADDGIEFFGGSVNVTNLLVVNTEDDMFDFTLGYDGTLTNAYGIWEAGFSTDESDPSGIEADGNHDGNFPDETHQSNFTVAGMTIDLRLDYVAGDNTRRMQSGMRIRRGATANITNALVKGTGRVETLINLTDSKGNANTATAVSLTNALTTAPDTQQNPATGYDRITIGGSNAGASASAFAWTGYRF